MVLKRKSPSCGAPRFRRRPSQGGRSAPDTRWHAACALPVAASAFPSFSNNTNRGALRKEGAPIHTFCVVLINTAASMTTPGAAAAKAAAATAAGTAETATAAAEASSAAKAAASRSAAAARRPGRARAGTRPRRGRRAPMVVMMAAHHTAQEKARAERRAAVISAVTAAAPAARPAERADERQHDHEEHDHPKNAEAAVVPVTVVIAISVSIVVVRLRHGRRIRRAACAAVVAVDAAHSVIQGRKCFFHTGVIVFIREVRLQVLL